MEQQLKEHEIINAEMFEVFKKAFICFVETMKDTYNLTLNTNEESKHDIIKKKINDTQEDLKYLMEKIKQHHAGIYTTYELEEAALFSEILTNFRSRSRCQYNFSGFLYNDQLNAEIFDNSVKGIDREISILNIIYELIKKFSRDVFFN